MKNKTTLRYLGAAIAACAMLLPLSSQADVYWSLNLSDGIRISNNHHVDRYSPYKARHHRHHAKHGHHQRHNLRKYYRHHRAQQHFAPYAYSFIPRHNSHYRHH